MIFAAVIALVAVVAVPWYMRTKGTKAAIQATTPSAENTQPASSQPVVTNEPAVDPTPNEAASPTAAGETLDFAKQQREARAREEARRVRAAENAAAISTASPAPTNVRPVATNQSESATSRKVTVQVTYDENGRVTQASGGDATALRIARQKRFPAGKAGSASITIPIN
jgi:flagellar basal body-associated protein FliL